MGTTLKSTATSGFILNYPQNYKMVKDVSILFYRISSVKLQMARPNLKGKKICVQDFQSNAQPVLQFLKLILFNQKKFM